MCRFIILKYRVYIVLLYLCAYWNEEVFFIPVVLIIKLSDSKINFSFKIRPLQIRNELYSQITTG